MQLFQELTSVVCGTQDLSTSSEKPAFFFFNFWSFTVPLRLFAILNLTVYLSFFCSFLSFLFLPYLFHFMSL